MHPGFFFWWGQTHGRERDFKQASSSCGSGAASAGSGVSYQAAGDGSCENGAGLGVRRPLRFLAYKLQLTEVQVGELARIISELKTERAQAEVDDRRVVATLADAVSGGGFDEAKAAQAGKQRVQSTERVQEAVVKALGRIHALLNEEQRVVLGYLIRTGTLSL